MALEAVTEGAKHFKQLEAATEGFEASLHPFNQPLDAPAPDSKSSLGKCHKQDPHGTARGFIADGDNWVKGDLPDGYELVFAAAGAHQSCISFPSISLA